MMRHFRTSFLGADGFQAKIMAKATETGNVVECAANEMLRTSLPVREKEQPEINTVYK